MTGNLKTFAGLCIAGALAMATPASAGPMQALMVTGAYTDGGQRAVALFDPMTGALLDGSYINLGTSGIMKHALQVGNEIWISEQAASVVHRYSLTGSFLGQINEAAPGQTLNNLRGMALVGDTVYLTNSGSVGGAPGSALVTYDMNGNWQGTHSLQDASPFSVLEYNNELLVAHSGAADIQRYSFDGNHLGPFHVGPVSWVQQMNTLSNGNIIATGWSSNGLYEYDSAGNQVNVIAADSPRGVHELGNGGLLWSNSAGVHIYDPNTGGHHTVLDGFNGQYIDMLIIPAPGGLALLALAGVIAPRRRRR